MANTTIDRSKQDKLKVVWLCYFSNDLVQKSIKSYRKIGEFAPWISNLIKTFENSDDIDLYVISGHEWISGINVFDHKGIHYIFYNKGMPFIGRHWPGKFQFDYWTDYYFIKKQINILVNKINPDIIHLHGAENDFSSSILQFYDQYPVFITIQGFIHKSEVSTKTAIYRKKREVEIIEKFKHFGVRTDTMKKDVLKINPNAVLHWHTYPKKKIIYRVSEKKYDLVFFARLTKDKGVEDLFQALALVKIHYLNISLCLIGGGKTEHLVNLANRLKIKENIHWQGFLPTQEDVHKLVSQSKISVLPTYHDIISGTIVESLFLKIPVIAYNVGSIHEINNNEEVVFLVEKQNIPELANTILMLLNNTKLQKERGDLGYKRAKEMFTTSNTQIKSDLMNAYHEVISDFTNGSI